MLLELKISKFAVIESLHLQFRPGLNILSGETGSGKSVLLKGLGLLMGEKASADTIRVGAQQATVEGSFDLSERADIRKKLEEMGIENAEEAEQLVVRRLISQGDKSRVYLNGHLSTLQSLRDIVAPLIEVTGAAAPLIEMTSQHENRNLMSKAYHLDLLDQHAGLWELRSRYEKEFELYAEMQRELEEWKKGAPSAAQRLDYLKFQSTEIEDMNLQDNEDVLLEQEVRQQKNLSKITTFVESMEVLLDTDEGSALDRIKVALRKASELQNLDTMIVEKMQGVEQAQTLIEDVLFDLRSYLQKVDSDPGRLESLEARLSTLRKLQKKYGSTAGEILQALQQMNAEIQLLENLETRITQREKELGQKALQLKKIAQELHQGRCKGALSLVQKVNKELEDLNMKGVRFDIEVHTLSDLTATGTSDIEFTSQTSAKDPKRPLAKFASGGELSRILLSLKKVVGNSHQPRTYLFDEVDSGVSGPTAEKVGRKLKSIAKGQQVICVTHLPQVAAFGDAHYLIQKNQKAGSVMTDVLELKNKDRVQEMARLISGEKVTKTSLAHAQELLVQAGR